MGSCEKGERDVRGQEDNSVFLREKCLDGFEPKKAKTGEVYNL